MFLKAIDVYPYLQAKMLVVSEELGDQAWS
jgi:hypothetical protein